MTIDGQTLRGSDDRAFGGAARCIWCGRGRRRIASCSCEEKPNEITVIPGLLKLLDLSEAIVTIDRHRRKAGGQTEIARQIREQQADYVLAVKDNQPKLCQSIRHAL